MPKPAAGEPALISFSDVMTMFHEFGHALHGMLADSEYPSLSGTSVARDFVEFPSQFNEHWATYPAVFAHYAKHYKTGAAMPEELAAKIKKAANFNQGYLLTELLAAAELDMQWHSLAVGEGLQDPDTFETSGLRCPSVFNLSGKLFATPRDAAVSLAQTRWASGTPVYGFEVDDAARSVIVDRGHGDVFIHRTGHSIDRELHGSGPNIDNLETRDGRRLIPGDGVLHRAWDLRPSRRNRPSHGDRRLHVGERALR